MRAVVRVSSSALPRAPPRPRQQTLHKPSSRPISSPPSFSSSSFSKQHHVAFTTHCKKFTGGSLGLGNKDPATARKWNWRKNAYRWKTLAVNDWGRTAPELTKYRMYGGKPFEAVVVRAKAAKTICVEHYWWQRHPKYQVPVKRRARMLVHDPNEICHPGDIVLVTNSRTWSKQKAHVVREIIRKEPGIAYLAANPNLLLDHVEELKAQAEVDKVETDKRLKREEEDRAYKVMNVGTGVVKNMTLKERLKLQAREKAKRQRFLEIRQKRLEGRWDEALALQAAPLPDTDAEIEARTAGTSSGAAGSQEKKS